MHGGAPERAAVPAFAAVLVPVLGAWNNMLAGRLSGRVYLVVNAAATGALLVAARRAGLSWDEVGLDRRRLAPGALWGAALSAPVAVGYAVALGSPRLRRLLRDARVAGLPPRDLAFHALVRIPVGTVLWEETAFRGVLRAGLRRSLPEPAATAVGAALFGVWHVRPTLAALTANGVVAERRTAAVAAGCLGTAASGVLFDELRRRSGSLLAPCLLHLTANVLGLLAAAAAHRLRPGRIPRRGGAASAAERPRRRGRWARCSTTTRWTT